MNYVYVYFIVKQGIFLFTTPQDYKLVGIVEIRPLEDTKYIPYTKLTNDKYLTYHPKFFPSVADTVFVNDIGSVIITKQHLKLDK